MISKSQFIIFSALLATAGAPVASGDTSQITSINPPATAEPPAAQLSDKNLAELAVLEKQVTSIQERIEVLNKWIVTNKLEEKLEQVRLDTAEAAIAFSKAKILVDESEGTTAGKDIEPAAGASGSTTSLTTPATSTAAAAGTTARADPPTDPVKSPVDPASSVTGGAAASGSTSSASSATITTDITTAGAGALADPVKGPVDPAAIGSGVKVTGGSTTGSLSTNPLSEVAAGSVHGGQAGSAVESANTNVTKKDKAAAVGPGDSLTGKPSATSSKSTLAATSPFVKHVVNLARNQMLANAAGLSDGAGMFGEQSSDRRGATGPRKVRFGVERERRINSKGGIQPGPSVVTSLGGEAAQRRLATTAVSVGSVDQVVVQLFVDAEELVKKLKIENLSDDTFDQFKSDVQSAEGKVGGAEAVLKLQNDVESKAGEIKSARATALGLGLGLALGIPVLAAVMFTVLVKTNRLLLNFGSTAAKGEDV